MPGVQKTSYPVPIPEEEQDSQFMDFAFPEKKEEAVKSAAAAAAAGEDDEPEVDLDGLPSRKALMEMVQKMEKFMQNERTEKDKIISDFSHLADDYDAEMPSEKMERMGRYAFKITPRIWLTAMANKFTEDNRFMLHIVKEYKKDNEDKELKICTGFKRIPYFICAFLRMGNVRDPSIVSDLATNDIFLQSFSQEQASVLSKALAARANGGVVVVKRKRK